MMDTSRIPELTFGRIGASLAVAALALLTTAGNARAASTDVVEQKFSVGNSGTLRVDASTADVNVKSWDEDELSVSIVRVSDGDLSAKDEDGFSADKIDVRQKGDVVYVSVKTPRNFHGKWSYKIEVKVPEGFAADIETVGGDISVKGLQGKLDLESAGGDVTLADCSGGAEIETRGGDIYCRDSAGTVDLESAGGDVSLENHSGKAKVEAAGGDVAMNNVSGPVDAEAAGGNIYATLTGESGSSYSFKTAGGDLELTMPEDSEVDVDGEVTAGEFNSYFDLDVKESNVKTRFSGSVNGGGSKLKVKSTGGDVTLRKAS